MGITACRMGGPRRGLRAPLFIVIGPDPDGAGESIGVGHSQDAVRAVELDIGEVGAPDAIAGEERGLSAAFELDYPRYEGRGAELERLPLARALIRRSLRIEDLCHAGHLADRA